MYYPWKLCIILYRYIKFKLDFLSYTRFQFRKDLRMMWYPLAMMEQAPEMSPVNKFRLQYESETTNRSAFLSSCTTGVCTCTTTKIPHQCMEWNPASLLEHNKLFVGMVLLWGFIVWVGTQLEQYTLVHVSRTWLQKLPGMNLHYITAGAIWTGYNAHTMLFNRLYKALR